MPENVKVPRSASPAARTGAGDISERELSRERYNLQTTPPARLQPAHPKKKLFFTPVSKFTAKPRSPTPQLARIRSCLEEFRTIKPEKMAAKAASMEDLTPTKRRKNEIPKDKTISVRAPGLHGIAEEEAAARVARFMVVAAWRRRRDDVRCLRRTLEFQVSCSERLRMQVSALKSLLDSDNAKVRLAIKELDRLKQLLKDKDIEKAVLQREKIALENDVCAAEDRASEMSIGWRNCRNELECLRNHTASIDRALRHERTANAALRAQRDRAEHELLVLKEEMSKQEELRTASDTAAAELRTELAEQRRALERTLQELFLEKQHCEESDRECVALNVKLAGTEADAAELRKQNEHLKEQLTKTELQLEITKEQLDWWPKPLTRLVGWARQGTSFRAALVWAATPACSHLPRSWIL